MAGTAITKLVFIAITDAVELVQIYGITRLTDVNEWISFLIVFIFHCSFFVWPELKQSIYCYVTLFSSISILLVFMVFTILIHFISISNFYIVSYILKVCWYGTRGMYVLKEGKKWHVVAVLTKCNFIVGVSKLYKTRTTLDFWKSCMCQTICKKSNIYAKQQHCSIV